MTTWHPATKLLVLAAAVGVPYLLLTGPEAPVVAEAARPAPEAADLAPPASEPPPFVLPPLERIAAVVERPLFSPSRRMPVPTEPEPEAVEATAEAVEEPVLEPEVDRPDLHFFGTVQRSGEAAALVTDAQTGAVAHLKPGDTVGDWTVLGIERNRLVLGLGDERLTYEIFADPASEEADDAGAEEEF